MPPAAALACRGAVSAMPRRPLAPGGASLYVWYLPSLPLANSLACQGFALAMLRSRHQERLPGKFLKYPLANRKKRWYNRKALGGVAHLGERLNGIQEVVGSIPIVSTKKKGLRFEVLFLLPIFQTWFFVLLLKI